MNPETKEWLMNHGPTLVLGVLVLVQWIAFQALLVHYHLFRKSLKKPQPDQMRFHMIEKAVSFQAEQVESIFKKLSDFRKEVSNVATIGDAVAASKAAAHSGNSFEASYASLGELALKKRLNQIRTSD